MDLSKVTDQTWDELLGSNYWKGLLEPLDLGLRHLILRCGDFCQATYDAFNNDQCSKFCGSSRFGKQSFFQKVALESAHSYQVVAFLYATARIGVHKAMLLHSQARGESWDCESNWIGYICVTTDEASKALGRREIYIAWRGTTRTYEWIDVLAAKPDSATSLLLPKTLKQYRDSDGNGSDSDDEDLPKVMKGWMTIYTSDDPNSPFTKLSARTQLRNKIGELIDMYKNENLSIVLTGHSLGASLSIVAGFDLVESDVTKNIPVSAIVFGSPQVGNKAFNERIKQYPNFKILHIKNCIDVIPHYPSRLLGYKHSGIELEIDTRKSPWLKDSKNPSDWHNLQAMLHIVAGWNGKREEFEMKVKRSLGLVNKSCEFLKDECRVPGCWWIEKNKGMVIDENGDWVLATPEDEDLPVPEI